MDDAELRPRARATLDGNYRDGYTVPAEGLYPYQWCWDSGPIALGWAAAGRWDRAWGELERLLSAQWPSGMVPHIVFWTQDDTYFPGPEVWATGRNPPTTGLTQPPLPATAAARLFAEDPDRDRATRMLRLLWPRLLAWLAWIERARIGPHGACIVVHPWESGMDNSPSWDQPLSGVPEATNVHLVRRDVVTVSAEQRPSTREYRQYLGIVEALRAAGWDTERQPADSPFAVEDPAFTAITIRAAVELAMPPRPGLDASPPGRPGGAVRAGLGALWDDELRWFRPYDLHRETRSVRPPPAGWSPSMPATPRRPPAPHAGAPRRLGPRLRRGIRPPTRRIRPSTPSGTGGGRCGCSSTGWWPTASAAWVVRGRRSGRGPEAATRSLVEQGFSEYYDPRTGTVSAATASHGAPPSPWPG